MKKLHATSTADMLASIPHNLGFKPANSLVMVAVNAENVLGATLRIDLPALLETGKVDTLAGLMRQDPTAADIIVVIYDNSDHPLRWKQPYLKLTDALEDEGLRLREAWMVTDEAYYSLSCEDPECCGPMPVEAIEESAVNAEFVFTGSAPSPDAGVVVPAPPTGELLERIRSLIAASKLHPLNGTPMDFGQPGVASASVEWWCALDWEPDEKVAADLIAHLGRKTVRDRLMADSIGAPYDDAGYRGALTGRSKRINWDEAVKYQRLALHLLNYAPEGELRATLLSMIAFIEWHKGQNSRTISLLKQAQSTMPGHRLSTLLLMLVDTGIIPDVLRIPGAAYTGVNIF